MFLSHYRPTSPTRRWTSFVKGYMIGFAIDKKLRSKFVGKQNETKKRHRSRKIGPSQQLQQTNKRSMQYSVTKLIVGSIKAARTNHINIATSCAGGILHYKKAHHGYYYGQELDPYYPPGTKDILLYPGTDKILGGIRIGSLVFSVPFGRQGLSMLARAPGTFCKVLWHHANLGLTSIKIPSQKLIKVSTFVEATLGRNTTTFFGKLVRGCARKTVKQYKKVKRVRGVAMNPVDHPNGGRSNTKQPLKNPWGLIAKKNK